MIDAIFVKFVDLIMIDTVRLLLELERSPNASEYPTVEYYCQQLDIKRDTLKKIVKSIDPLGWLIMNDGNFFVTSNTFDKFYSNCSGMETQDIIKKYIEEKY